MKHLNYRTYIPFIFCLLYTGHCQPQLSDFLPEKPTLEIPQENPATKSAEPANDASPVHVNQKATEPKKDLDTQERNQKAAEPQRDLAPAELEEKIVIETPPTDILIQEPTLAQEIKKDDDIAAIFEKKIEEKIDKEILYTPIYQGQFLRPWEHYKPKELVEFEFENADLEKVAEYIEKHFGLTFIYDDAIKPIQKGGKSIMGSKVTFTTNRPLTKKQAWDIFLSFLDMAGLTTVPGPYKGAYRITTVDPKALNTATKGPIPVLIGTDPKLIPDNDTRIRYIYFVENTTIDVVKNVLETMKSQTSPKLVVFPELRAIIITDKAYNIKAMLNVIRELDNVNMPETLSIIKLRRTDATKVAKLYNDLIKAEGGQQRLAARLLGGRRQQTVHYFDSTTRIIPEPRTNTLILLGTKESIERIEEFITKEIDKVLDIPFSPLHVYHLKHVKADAIAQILKEAVQFRPKSDAARAGGVRDGDKYFKPISIVPEKSSNSLIINAEYGDYIKIHELLEKIDVEQPQVALKVMIMSVDITDNRILGIQMRNKVPGPNGLLSDNVSYQTSGLSGQPVQERQNASGQATGTGATRLLGDLVNLAKSTKVGSTVMTLGSDIYGVWGLLQVLQTYTHVSVLADPFLVTTNKYPASISLGQTRRIKTATTLSSSGNIDSFADLSALTSVTILPQISYEGLITLEVSININNFTNTDQSSGDRTEREIKTSVIMGNNEVLALGGLARDRYEEANSQFPVLGRIPIIGWFFKNKAKSVEKTSLLILISPEIIPAEQQEVANKFTQNKMQDLNETLSIHGSSKSESKDPIHRWFFKDNKNEGKAMLDSFIEKQGRYIPPSQRKNLVDLIEPSDEKPRKEES